MMILGAIAAAVGGFLSGYGVGKPKDSRCLHACKIALTGCAGVQFPLNPEQCAAWCEEGWGKAKTGMEFEITELFQRRPPAGIAAPAETPTSAKSRRAKLSR